MRSVLPFLLAAAPVVAAAAPAAPPVVLYHQGRLLQNNDSPVEGPKQITVALYGSDEGGTAKWSETYDLTLSRGLFGVALGDTSGGKKALTADDVAGERWLGVTVEGVELKPRLRLGTVPYATLATLADEALVARDAQKLGGRLPADYALAAELPNYAPLAGATFTGPVLLPAPTEDAHAATKRYVDEAQAADALAMQLLAPLANPIFTGTVTVPAPTEGSHATTKQYVDDTTAALTAYVDDAAASTKQYVDDNAAAAKKYVDDAQAANAQARQLLAPRASPTFTGAVTVPAPSADAHAATKKYVDDKHAEQAAAIATLAPLASPTFTGTVTVPAPSSDTSASTKKYVDDQVAASASQSAAALANYAALAGATFAGAVSVPSPTQPSHAATKKYVDDTVASAIAAAGINVTSSRPSTATSGQLIYNSASGGLELYDGARWQVFGGSYPSCKAILDAGASQGDGVYTIRPDANLPPFRTFCDMTTAGGGWTLVGSLVDQDVQRGGDSWEQRWNRSGFNAWADQTTFGDLGTATKSSNGDYKNAAYFALNASNLLVYHTPNDTAAEQLRARAHYAYYTTSNFLAAKGGSLYSLFKTYHPIVRGTGNTEAFRETVTFAIGTAAAHWSESNPNNKAESEAGKMSFLRRNGEGTPFAFCITGYNGHNSEHSCVGGNGDTNGRGAGGWGNFRDWLYDASWGQSPKLRASALLMFVR